MNIHKATQEFYWCNAIHEQRRCAIGVDGVCEECVPSTSEAFVTEQREKLQQSIDSATAFFEFATTGLLV